MDPSNNTYAYIDETIRALEHLFMGSRYKAMDKFIKSSRGESMILKMLSLNGGTLKPSRMAELMGTTKGRISSILNSLEDKGLVSRDVDKNNRRSVIVSLTDEGRRCNDKECGEIRSFMAGVFEDMGESDSREFIRLMDRFFDLMDEHINDNSGEQDA